MALSGIRFGASLGAAIAEPRLSEETVPPPSTQAQYLRLPPASYITRERHDNSLIRTSCFF